jgi:hypothetical protein
MIIPIGPFQIFLKIRGDIRSSRCTTGVVDTSGKLKKSSIRKIFFISFGHLWVILTEYSGAGGKLIHEKNQKQKLS